MKLFISKAYESVINYVKSDTNEDKEKFEQMIMNETDELIFFMSIKYA